MDFITDSSAMGILKYSCKYPLCNNRYYIKNKVENYRNKQFHRFPKNPELNKIWLSICKLEDKGCKGIYICEDHFKPSDYVNESKRILKHGSFPSILQTTSNSGEGNSSFFISELEPVCNAAAPHIESDQMDFSSTLKTNMPINASLDKPIAPCNIECSDGEFVIQDKYSFLREKKVGILGKAGLSEKNLTPEQNIPYRDNTDIKPKILIIVM